jgi:zinc transport system substrate-binding protein
MRFLFGAAILYSVLSCQPAAENTAPEGGGVFVTSYPLEYFAERIAGESVEITFFAPPDVDPAFWMPDDEQVAAMQRADLVLLNGATYEKWLDKVSLPAGTLVDTSEVFADDFLELVTTVTHTHGEAGEHSHTGTDFNTWVDPVQARSQAHAVLEALKKTAPEHAATFEKNAEKLQADLEALDKAFGELGDAARKPILASHPVYGYLARRYDWNLESMLWEPDVMPHDEEWQELAQILEYHEARWIIYEDEPLPEIATKLKDGLGVETVIFRPCGNRPPEGDYLSEYQAGIERLRAVFKP